MLARGRFALAVSLVAIAALAGIARAQSPVLGSAAPDCTLAAIGDGPGYDIRQFRGKVVYVDFWASWCTTCVLSFPFLNELDREYRDRGLQVLGINLDQKPADARTFLAKHPARFTIAADRGGACPRSFDVRAMPMSYLIDRRGVVRYQHVGFRSGETEQIRSQVAALLAEPGPAQ